MTNIAFFAVVLLLSYGLGAILRDWATRHRLLDHPNERSSHATPTPRTGGVAIVASTAIGVAAAIAMGVCTPTRVEATASVAVLVIAFVGALDDWRSLPSWLRLAVHLAAAGALVAAVRAAQPGLFAAAGMPELLAIALAIVWIAGLTNAYNFMDGIDGLAGGQALIAGLAWSLLGRQNVDGWVEVTGLLIAAATAGFLLHNWAPARLFMGDAGSTALGYMFAAFPIAAGDRAHALAGVVLMWPFVFDTSLTFVRRLVRGENVMAAHRSHLYQRLIAAGWSHRRTSLTYYVLAAIAAAGALSIARAGATPLERAALALAIAGVISAAMWTLVRIAELRDSAGRSAAFSS
jgi:UDP-N-acetylmuramyl pentapeptide phosphotransferase/UDP-N-acetylglucosamine-1-phosphate transferase